MTSYRDRLNAGHHDAKKQATKQAKEQTAASTKTAQAKKTA
jgi:hypothetical protein